MADAPLGARNGIIHWIDDRLPFLASIQHHYYEYPTPRNLSYWWNFGSLAGIMLVVMIVTGIVLATQYTPSADLAFDSVERIMRDVNYGWLIRYPYERGVDVFCHRLHPSVSRALLRLL
jgi:ubiquinol-cytochrome c reductase cytochrome b subunit